MGGTWTMIPYFCGDLPECHIPSEKSLNMAKEAIRKHYILVGVLEDYSTTLKLLEALLPGYFGGASRLYALKKDLLIYSGRTKIKLAPSKTTIGLVQVC